MSEKPLIETRDLKQHFPLRKGLFGGKSQVVKAVDGISIEIPRRSVLGLVGESGSGKSTFGQAVMGLTKPTAGSMTFDGIDMATASPAELRGLKRRMQMVFQDPFSSLNPRMSVAETLGVPLRFHESQLNGAQRKDRAAEMLERVGLPGQYVDRFPHEFSGGQRQRIGIARALMVHPDFIMADEVVSALDVSVQAQVLNLFGRLQRDLELTMLFITHDLAVVGHVSDFVAVMYLGRVVELAPTRALFTSPKHPYTEALLSAAPTPQTKSRRQRIVLKGDIPSPLNPPSGCPFRTRCPYALEECAHTTPELREFASGHKAACIRDDLSLASATQQQKEPA
ncbi:MULTISPECIES: ABC transporter ATP-binding protein [Salipiger]|uniref:Oligopeptide transport system ATP-binding protein n=1 Tax=Salipiger profundus TaxID=1229727 RepID=A0A1U7DDM2_9RHOB|nr:MULTISPECIES: oligopeptide/dipeptide ABC transporter ATP-binding protein [Salipiger]APX26264.1 oligopeptide transport system ATP-binding protein [Salipiger profundus]GGA27518.1 ABC transporter ATP-binding protein [Salipiger profundus]